MNFFLRWTGLKRRQEEPEDASKKRLKTGDSTTALDGPGPSKTSPKRAARRSRALHEALQKAREDERKALEDLTGNEVNGSSRPQSGFLADGGAVQRRRFTIQRPEDVQERGAQSRSRSRLTQAGVRYEAAGRTENDVLEAQLSDQSHSRSQDRSTIEVDQGVRVDHGVGVDHKTGHGNGTTLAHGQQQRHHTQNALGQAVGAGAVVAKASGILIRLKRALKLVTN